MGLSVLDRLRLFLRPPGKGLYTHSSGAGFAARVLHGLYGTDVGTEINDAWEDSLQRIRRVDTIVLGIPSDSGAGVSRGANLGPIGIREAYLKEFSHYPKNAVDVGDVICIPQLLHDEMLSDSQLAASRRELYPGKEEALPVSPLSITEQVLYALYELNPDARIVLLGGDHSVSWPAMLYCHRRCAEDFGVLHLDAHTDLLEQRLGVKHCFGTWAYHALKLVKPHCFVQVGIRSSSKPKEYWMERFPLVQIWAAEVRDREKEMLAKIVHYLKEVGVKKLYISNDIDGTDSPSIASESNGLSSKFVLDLIELAKQEFQLIGADVVEVAPALSGSRDFASDKNSRLAAQYLHSFF